MKVEVGLLICYFEVLGLVVARKIEKGEELVVLAVVMVKEVAVMTMVEKLSQDDRGRECEANSIAEKQDRVSHCSDL